MVITTDTHDLAPANKLQPKPHIEMLSASSPAGVARAADCLYGCMANQSDAFQCVHASKHISSILMLRDLGVGTRKSLGDLVGGISRLARPVVYSLRR